MRKEQAHDSRRQCSCRICGTGILARHAFYVCATIYIIAAQLLLLRSFSSTYHPELFRTYWPLLTANAIADALLLTAAYWLLPRKRQWMLWIVIWLFSLWCFALTLYDVSYGDVMPFSSFVLFGNVGGVLAKSAFGNALQRPLCLFFIVAPAVMYALVRKKAHYDDATPLRRGRRLCAVLASLAFYALVRVAVPAFFANGDTYFSTAKQIYCTISAKHKSYIYYNGTVAYAGFCLAHSIPHTLSDAERAQVSQFIDELSEPGNLPGFEHNKGKNVIFILVESLNAWAVNMSIDGKAVMPTLSALASDSTAVASIHMISQAKNGRSSDGKFTYLTGLLPLQHEAVAMSYPHGNYPSIVKALKLEGYYAGEISVDQKGLWNVEEMSRGYGFDTLIYTPQLGKKFAARKWRLDEVVMEETALQATRWKEPFFMLTFTGSMHSPYSTSDSFAAEWITSSREYTPEVRNYLAKANYFDTQLALLLDRLRRSGIMQRSIIVVASDHSEPVDYAATGRPAISPQGDECVLVICGTGKGLDFSGYMAQVDVYPTLLDVLALRQYHWHALGTSIFRNHCGTAAPNAHQARGKSSDDKQTRRQMEAWKISEMMITSGWFKTK